MLCRSIWRVSPWKPASFPGFQVEYGPAPYKLICAWFKSNPNEFVLRSNYIIRNTARVAGLPLPLQALLETYTHPHTEENSMHLPISFQTALPSRFPLLKHVTHGGDKKGYCSVLLVRRSIIGEKDPMKCCLALLSSIKCSPSMLCLLNKP